MRTELRELHHRLGATMVYVTHDQVEAMTMADKIVVLRAGRVEQVGTPQELYTRPCNTFVAGFIGSPRMNFLPAAAWTRCAEWQGHLPSKTDQVGVRPEHWAVCGSDQGLVQAELLDETRVEVLLSGDLAVGVGDTLNVVAELRHVHAFDPQGLRLEGLQP
jgi:ABC-type sugar transport system ATPase subunit